MKALLRHEDRVCLINLSELENADGVKEVESVFAQAVKLVQDDKADNIIVNVEGVDMLLSGCLRVLASSSLALRKFQKKISLEKASIKLRKFLSGHGLADLFAFTSSDSFKKNTILINVEFINPFIDGALETLKIQCGTVAATDPVCLKKTFQRPYQIDIMGVIGLTSRTFTGSIALCFPKETFLAIMSKMLGEPFTVINNDLKDGAGELLNIIFGMAKVKLNGKNHHIEKAIPSVIQGKEIEVTHIVSDVAIVVPFHCDAGKFHMEIGLEPQSGHS